MGKLSYRRFAFCYSERGLREPEAENAKPNKPLAEAHLNVEAQKVAPGAIGCRAIVRQGRWFDFPPRMARMLPSAPECGIRVRGQ